MNRSKQSPSDRWDGVYQSGRDFTQLEYSSFIRLLRRIEGSITRSDAGRSLLDLGCGTGQLARDFAVSGFRVTGADISSVAIQSAQLEGREVDYRQIDALSDLLSWDKRFDVVVCKYVLPFVADKEELVAAVASVLAPGGSFVVINPRYRSFVYDKGLATYARIVRAQLASRFVVESRYQERLHHVFLFRAR